MAGGLPATGLGQRRGFALAVVGAQFVTDVGDANTALERFRNGGPFDLVITDIGLPGGFSGRQVAKAMRMQLAQQKILFITGYADQSIEAQLLDQPGTALLNKPLKHFLRFRALASERPCDW